MGYSKFYYALLELRKVVIFACFNVTIYIQFEFLNYELVYIVNYSDFFSFLTSSLSFFWACLHQKVVCFSFLFNWIHCCQFAQFEYKVTLTLLEGTIIYKTLIFVLNFYHYNHITKKSFVNNLWSVIVTIQKDVFLLERMITKKCVTQTKM